MLRWVCRTTGLFRGCQKVLTLVHLSVWGGKEEKDMADACQEYGVGNDPPTPSWSVFHIHLMNNKSVK
jgi:hypothetical protein